MRITEIAKRTGATTDQIRYLERKKYVKVRWRLLKNRRVRDYPHAEVHRIELIMKYLEQGFRYDIAYEKAKEEMERPRLI